MSHWAPGQQTITAPARYAALVRFASASIARTVMISNTISALSQAAERVREQIPTGGLTRAYVEELLHAAEAVLADADAAPKNRSGARQGPTKRQIARQRWAEIARGNSEEVPEAPGTMP